MTSGPGRPFLTARWESLVLLSFDCPREFLEPLLPGGIELDSWHGSDLISLVGFRFVDTRIRGIRVPWHRTFEEVNLRFYVRRTGPDGSLRRAVVFIKELVPRRAIVTVARLLYNEPYSSVAMNNQVSLDAESGGTAAYGWMYGGFDYRLHARVSGAATVPVPGSEAEFITEHYWGYTGQRDGSTLEYRVDHPSWRVWTASEASYESPATQALYGPRFSEVLAAEPSSAFVAMGSEVTVYSGVKVSRALEAASGSERGGEQRGRCSQAQDLEVIE